MSQTQHWTDFPNAPAVGTPLIAFSALMDGAVTMCDVAAFRSLLLRSGEAVWAYVNACPHFGVPLAKKPEHLLFKPHQSLSCNVHYARFRWQDGVCEFGDCKGDRLSPIPVCVENGLVKIAE